MTSAGPYLERHGIVQNLILAKDPKFCDACQRHGIEAVLRKEPRRFVQCFSRFDLSDGLEPFSGDDASALLQRFVLAAEPITQDACNCCRSVHEIIFYDGLFLPVEVGGEKRAVPTSFYAGFDFAQARLRVAYKFFREKRDDDFVEEMVRQIDLVSLSKFSDDARIDGSTVGIVSPGGGGGGGGAATSVRRGGGAGAGGLFSVELGFHPEASGLGHNAVRLVERRPDYARMRRWLELCRGQHAGCRREPSESLARIWLIDVEAGVLVSYPPGEHVEYLALSYVWGGVEQPTASLGSLPERMVQTVKDAMQVTRELGLKYLWVDSVCIAQDDPDQKASQIQIMKEIYSSAFATLIALEGKTASDGLKRVHDSRIDWHQITFELSGHQLIAKPPALGDMQRRSTWAERAWTFQEGLFSHRKFFFTQRGVYFSCNTIGCTEAGDEDYVFKYPERSRSFQYFDLVNVETVLRGQMDRAVVFTRFINNYVHRAATIQADYLNAIAGVLDALTSGYFPKGFFYGLPQEEFISSLMWHCSSRRNRTLTRREFYPSWSWLGWAWPRTDAKFVSGLLNSNTKEYLRCTSISSVDPDAPFEIDMSADPYEPVYNLERTPFPEGGPERLREQINTLASTSRFESMMAPPPQSQKIRRKEVFRSKFSSLYGSNTPSPQTLPSQPITLTKDLLKVKGLVLRLPLTYDLQLSEIKLKHEFSLALSWADVFVSPLIPPTQLFDASRRAGVTDPRDRAAKRASRIIIDKNAAAMAAGAGSDRRGSQPGGGAWGAASEGDTAWCDMLVLGWEWGTRFCGFRYPVGFDVLLLEWVGSGVARKAGSGTFEVKASQVAELGRFKVMRVVEFYLG